MTTEQRVLRKPVLGCFVAMLFQVLHEGRSAGSDRVWVLVIGLRLTEDVRCRIFQM